MGKRIVDGLTKTERVNRRKGLGTLRSLLVKPATVTRYEKAFAMFINFLMAQKMTLAYSLEALDSQVQCYLDSLWKDGESLSLAGDTLSALQHFQPSCKRRLQGGWRLLKAWQLHELPSRAPPFTWGTLLVVLGRFYEISPVVALGIHLAFRALLRTGELLALESKGIIISPNKATAILNLGLTKTGARNPAAGTVHITDYELVTRLFVWQRSLKSSQKLIPWSGTRFRQLFHEVLASTGLLSHQFKPYSLRRGGATDLWLSSQNYSLVAHTGRWSSERTLKVYIQDSMVPVSPRGFREGLQELDLAGSLLETSEEDLSFFLDVSSLRDSFLFRDPDRSFLLFLSEVLWVTFSDSLGRSPPFSLALGESLDLSFLSFFSSFALAGE